MVKYMISLSYSLSEQKLSVTVHQATDISPRNDGSARNPFVKVFLLPDRSETSRRQSVTLAGTCHPVWQQTFTYQPLDWEDVCARVMEITVWDYSEYDSNYFLGETLIDLANNAFYNEGKWHLLVDMKDDSPLRLKAQRYSKQFRRSPDRAQSTCFVIRHEAPQTAKTVRPRSCIADYSGYVDSLEDTFKQGIWSQPIWPYFVYSSSDFDPIGSLNCLSSNRIVDVDYPRGYDSNTTLNCTGIGVTGPGSSNSAISRRNYKQASSKSCDTETEQNMKSDQFPKRRPSSSAAFPPERRNSRRQRPVSAIPAVADKKEMWVAGYRSDDSETSLSLISSRDGYQTKQTKNIRINPPPQPSLSMEDKSEGSFPNINEKPQSNDKLSRSSLASVDQAYTKKKLMSRFIQNKIGGRNFFEHKKVMGFSRSEEVGLRYSPCSQNRASLLPQGSTESAGSQSSDSSMWQQTGISTDPSFTQFISTLGPGQVVGRQVLASPCLAELQLILSAKNGVNLEVKIIRARKMAKKPGAKYNPAPYVKMYLMEGKRCVAKAKTNVAARVPEPRFDQHLIFTETFSGRCLQVSMWGDYGRMERKSFMGIALIKLDNCDFSAPIDGWYKLYHTNSLIGIGRRESEALITSRENLLNFPDVKE